VTITNGAKGTDAQDDSYVCMTCHRARESTLTLNAADPTGATATFTLSFKNSHYLAAGATQYGNKAATMYQYNGKSYAQRWDHDQEYLQPYPATTWYRAQCAYCHMQDGSHSFDPVVDDTCTFCHVNSTSVDDLTPAFTPERNYDGDPATKPKQEYAVFQQRLLDAIIAYCANADQHVVYTDSYPYFIKDTDKDGVKDPNETSGAKFDSKSFRASYNYNYAVHEPGGWAHNPKYVLQVLYDSIQDIGGNLDGLTRPN
jgi:hypothetical protein